MYSIDIVFYGAAEGRLINFLDNDDDDDANIWLNVQSYILKLNKTFKPIFPHKIVQARKW